MTGFEYFKLALIDNYAKFDGRSRRSEFWYFTLFSILISWALTAVSYLIMGSELLSYVWSVAALIPSLAVWVRRLHDLGKSGWNFLLVLIPLVGFILLIGWAATDGQEGTNQYGPDPKAGMEDEVADHLIKDDLV